MNRAGPELRESGHSKAGMAVDMLRNDSRQWFDASLQVWVRAPCAHTAERSQTRICMYWHARHRPCHAGCLNSGAKVQLRAHATSSVAHQAAAEGSRARCPCPAAASSAALPAGSSICSQASSVQPMRVASLSRCRQLHCCVAGHCAPATLPSGSSSRVGSSHPSVAQMKSSAATRWAYASAAGAGLRQRWHNCAVACARMHRRMHGRSRVQAAPWPAGRQPGPRNTRPLPPTVPRSLRRHAAQRCGLHAMPPATLPSRLSPALTRGHNACRGGHQRHGREGHGRMQRRHRCTNLRAAQQLQQARGARGRAAGKRINTASLGVARK